MDQNKATRDKDKKGKRALCMDRLHYSLTGEDLEEQDLKTVTEYVFIPTEEDISFNENRAVEKLKLDLIYQGRDEEARSLVELHQRLINAPATILRRRESIVRLLYETFDRDYTSTTDMINSTEVSKNGSNPHNQNYSEELNSSYPRSKDLTSFVTMGQSGHDFSSQFQENESSYRTNSEVNLYSSTNKKTLLQSTIQIDKNFNAMPMPVLHKPGDEDLRYLLHRSTNKVPSLTKSLIGDLSASTIFRSPTFLVDQQSSMMVFPPDHGRYLLSEGSLPQGVRPCSTRSFSISADFASTTGPAPSQVDLYPRTNQSSRIVGLNRATQKTLLRDLVYVFQGINGSTIKAVSSDDSYEICVSKLHPSLRLQVLRLCEMGFFFVKLKTYCDKPSTGLMVQGFKYGLENELQDYYRLLAVITKKLQVEEVDAPMSEELGSFQESEIPTLHKLSVWSFESRYRLEVLVSVIDACENKSGGELCSSIYRYTEHGDPMVASMANSLLTYATKPVFLILCQWILYGELDDPHNEFFISAEIGCKKEQLWHSKFQIREKMLPCFISLKKAQKILSTGKNINFLRDVCHNSKGYEGRNEIKENLENTPVECIFLEDDLVLEKAIDSAYRTTSEMVLKILMEESHLLEHLQAIKRYLLLGQGDFIQYLLELLQDELDKPVSKLYAHNLSAILESAVRATNAQFEDEDILNRLEARILPGNERETGWDVFCLDYKADGPIGTILSEGVLVRYNRLFNTLWRIKRIEAMISTLWKNQRTLYKFRKVMPELGPVLHRSQLLISEMIQFVHQTQYYIMFEVTECAWDSLMKEVRKAADLDQVINAHEKFLETIMRRLLLHFGKRDLLNQLRGIFSTIILLKDFLAKFEDHVTAEVNKKDGQTPHESTAFDPLEAQKERRLFGEYLAHAKGEIDRIRRVTLDLIRSFLLVLNCQQGSDSLTLQCLSFRLDFSEYYSRKDSRVNFPLTFLHRRLSLLGISNPLPYYPSSLNQSTNQSLSQSNGTNELPQLLPGPQTSSSLNNQTLMSSIPESPQD